MVARGLLNKKLPNWISRIRRPACQKIEKAIERRGTWRFTQQSRKKRPPRKSRGARGPESKARRLSPMRLPEVCQGTPRRGPVGVTGRGFGGSGKTEMKRTGI